MFELEIQHLNCEFCGHELVYNYKATFDSYCSELNCSIETVVSTVDEIVCKFLVYECLACKRIYRYTYKEVEKRVRYAITKQVLSAIARGKLNNTAVMFEGVLIYCGKCAGFDGLGSCTKKIYDKCEVKRFPNGI